MCRVLEVSVSGFYAWRKRPVCTRKREDGELATQIQETFEQHRQVYGSPRIHAQLRIQGIRCGRKRVVRLMQDLNLSARRPSSRIVTTSSDPTARFAPNVLDRQFTATMPNEKWVADVTYIATEEGWLFLAVVMDVFSRRIIGWAMAGVQDDQLVVRALRMALTSRRPTANLLHHSDRGSQYTSEQYQQVLASWHIQVSMSRTGNCYDNAVMERFFATLKGECIRRQRLQTREQAQYIVFEYIECFYNRTRLHSSLQYVSPVQFESKKS
jgi:putative transposase